MEQRQSRQRAVVLEVVRSTMDHPTAEWVHRQARRRLPHISLGTVYRNLKRLAEEGLIREVHTGGHSARFDGNTGRHYHVRCLGCGRVNDLPLSVDGGIEQAAAQATNFHVVGHTLEVQGLCPQCRELHKSGMILDQSSLEPSAGAPARPTPFPNKGAKTRHA